MTIFYPSKPFALFFITCLSSLTIFAAVDGGQISFSASSAQTSFQGCSATTTPIYNYILPTGGSGQYLFSWERKVGPDRDWAPVAGSTSTLNATVDQDQFIYYRRKVKNQNNPNDSAFSNEIYTYSYPASHGAIQFEVGTSQASVMIGDLPPRIVNLTFGSVTHGPISYQFERKTGVNGVWQRVSGYNRSDAAPYQPPAPVNSTDTVYYRRYVSDALCGSIPDGTNPVSVIGISGTLPVTWIYAGVVKANNKIEVQWKVANEVNSSHYDILRSEDGISFIKIATVAAKGISSSAVSYTFAEAQENTSGNTFYYRIRQIDKDNKYNLSPVLRIKSNKSNLLELFPNPVTTLATLKAGNVIKHVSVTDMSGRVIFNSTNHTSTVTIDATTFAKGIYFVKAWLITDEQKTFRIVKQ